MLYKFSVTRHFYFSVFFISLLLTSLLLVYWPDENPKVILPVVEAPENSVKTLLIWTNPSNMPVNYLPEAMGQSQNGFQDHCTYTNCHITANYTYFENPSRYDAVLFLGTELISLDYDLLPIYRSPHQKYIFANIESADYYPICNPMFDDFFNWTWTYKLDSDSRWGYIVVRDRKGNIVGPQKEMHWIKEMDPIDQQLALRLASKTKAAAWFNSNCVTKSRRERFVKSLQHSLLKFGLKVDIYGKCGQLKCPKIHTKTCWEMIEKDYYFYLSFENGFSEDYVSEKIIAPLNHNTVPIVYGGANYSRFLPDGSYLNAREMGYEKLAQMMNEIIQNQTKYHDFFRWQHYYSFHRTIDSPETNEYCNFCALLNNKTKLETVTTYKHIRKWWNTHERPALCTYGDLIARYKRQENFFNLKRNNRPPIRKEREAKTSMLTDKIWEYFSY